MSHVKNFHLWHRRSKDPLKCFQPRVWVYVCIKRSSLYLEENGFNVENGLEGTMVNIELGNYCNGSQEKFR